MSLADRLVALAQAIGADVKALNAAPKPGTEIAYAENISGVLTSVSGNFTYSQIDGCGIVVPPQTLPFYIEWEAAVQVVVAGGGAMYVALMEIPAGGGTAVLVESAVREVVPTNSGTYSKFAGTVHGKKRFDPTTVYRTFAVSLVNLLDSGSGLTSNAANSTTNPSRIGAVTL